MAELFSAEALRDLHARFDIVWGQDGTIPDDLYSKALPHACAIIAAQPRLSMAVSYTHLTLPTKRIV